jgi:hypothetical protein
MRRRVFLHRYAAGKRERSKRMKTYVLEFGEVAGLAGFKPGPDGKLNLPPTQETADRLTRAATDGFAQWRPGDEACEVVMTGAGPIWACLCVAHGLHGRCQRLRYVSPNCPDGITVFSHGVKPQG